MAERFTVSALGVGGGSVVLGDDGITSPRNIVLAPPLPSPQVEIQTVKFVRAKRASTFARGNVVCPYSWRVTRTFSTIAQAVTFIRDHSKEIAAKCALGQFVLRRDVFGVSMQSTGALKSWRCTDPIGVKCTWEYEWQGTPFE